MIAIDRLYKSVAARGPVCVGLDTAFEYLPPQLIRTAEDPSAALLRYNCALIDATEDIAACYKIQTAFYEALGLRGLEVYAKTLSYIRLKNRLVIADVKRGDIADTAIRYAQAHFSGNFEADFVTVSAYMGMDSLMPWFEAAQERGKGAFVLMRTSNEGRKDFECQKLESGKSVYEAVADKLAALARQAQGDCGYGIFGAVVGCPQAEEAAFIREVYKNLFFLIPGYGAQGGCADEAALLLTREGNGGVINASRSVLKAWQRRAEIAELAADKALAAAMQEARSFVRMMQYAIQDSIQALVKEETNANR
ncbi:MAG: orotidine-5'-phosphate decarboxylase [Spirochaetaceae bacterium]|jgi:orotidine-5'-phosphate decarboxylase|nr:orotidine-5'-phosphate decarboxylase [Spirochaetaceae bacterium]